MTTGVRQRVCSRNGPGVRLGDCHGQGGYRQSARPLGAALFIAIGDVVQQRSAREVTDKPVGNIELFTKLLRDRR